MKKFTFGYLCLFSLVLCAGVHAMEKNQKTTIEPCWKLIYKLVEQGRCGGVVVDDVIKIVDESEKLHFEIGSRDLALRNLIRLIAEVRKSKLYAINEKNEDTIVVLDGILEEYKKSNEDLFCHAQDLKSKGKLSCSVMHKISLDCRFLYDKSTYCFVWSAQQGFVNTIKHLLGASSPDTYKCVFLWSLELACFCGNLEVVKHLVENVKVPVYRYGPDGFGRRSFTEYGGEHFFVCYNIEDSDCPIIYGSAHKYKEKFNIDNKVMFYDDAFCEAAMQGNIEIAKYLLTNEQTKDKISDYIKARLILIDGARGNNMDIVTCMMNFEKQKLINYNVKVLESVSKELKKKNK